MPPKKRTPSVSGKKKVVFKFNAPEASSVCVAGTFNEWSPEKHPLKKKKGRVWERAVTLAPGRYEYRFIINGTVWENDQQPDGCCPNGLGEQNCVKVVT